jgi:hypothetical protein
MSRSLVLGMSLASFDNYQQYKEYENPPEENKDYFINQSTDCKPDYDTFLEAVNDRWDHFPNDDIGRVWYVEFCSVDIDMRDYIDELYLDSAETLHEWAEI